VPRARAIAGLHALLDAGYPANQLAAALNPDPVEHIRTAAAVLDHRVADLCRQAELDPALYDLPAPTTAQQEWNTITDLLAHAETNHLATSPTPDLAAERRNLTAAVARLADHSADAGLAAASQARVELESRLRRVEAALDRQSADALLHAKAEPASYLSALLGSRPPHDDAKAAEWDQAAGRVERYRHHVLGLPYGTPAQPDAMDPVHQALGDRPSHPTYAAEYDHAHDINSLNDGQLAL
jgi:hypothetical protein